MQFLHRWTATEDTLLLQLWGVDGYSASQCAAEIGVKRNAVIGRARRLGIKWAGHKAPRLPQTPEAKAKAAMQRAARAAHIAARATAPLAIAPLAIAPPAIAPPPPAVVVKAAEGNGAGCQWPIGDPPNFHFCDNEKREGSSYCEEHHRLSRQPKRM